MYQVQIYTQEWEDWPKDDTGVRILLAKKLAIQPIMLEGWTVRSHANLAIMVFSVYVGVEHQDKVNKKYAGGSKEKTLLLPLPTPTPPPPPPIMTSSHFNVSSIVYTSGGTGANPYAVKVVKDKPGKSEKPKPNVHLFMKKKRKITI